jgi:hypothetical protein
MTGMVMTATDMTGTVTTETGMTGTETVTVIIPGITPDTRTAVMAVHAKGTGITARVHSMKSAMITASIRGGIRMARKVKSTNTKMIAANASV